MGDFRDILKHDGELSAHDFLRREGQGAVRMASAERDRVTFKEGKQKLASDVVKLTDTKGVLGKGGSGMRSMKGLSKVQRRRVMKRVAKATQAAYGAFGTVAGADDADSLDDAQLKERLKSPAARLGQKARSAAAKKLKKRATSEKRLIKAEKRATKSVRAAAQTEAAMGAGITGEVAEAGIIARFKRVAENTALSGAAVAAPVVASAVVAVMLAVTLIISLVMIMTGDEMMNDGWGFEGLTDNELIVAVYLKGKGLDKVHTAAVMGNISQECGFDTSLIENGSAAGVGIFQWPTTTDGGHGNRMKAYVQSTGREWTNIYGQLDYAWYEISGSAESLPGDPAAYTSAQWLWNYESGCTDFLTRAGISRSPGASFERWREQPDVDVATEYFCWGFLRPATWAANTEHRKEEARRYLAIFNTGGGAGSMVTDPARQAILSAARSQLGVPYVWGGTTPGVGLDCSGLTQYCYRQAGISIPRTSEEQMKAGTTIPISQAQPGDLLWRQGHIAIYIGDGAYIHAPHTGSYVQVAMNVNSFTYAVRF